MSEVTVQKVSQQIKLAVAVKNIGGNSFVGVRNYTNKDGEESNYTFNVGIKYDKVLSDDLKTLKNFDISTLVGKHSLIDLTTGYNQLLESLEKRNADEETQTKLLANNDATMLRSEAQKDAYTLIANGLKYKIENDQIVMYVWGMLVRKTVLKPIVYKAINSRSLTLAKNAIEKAAGLRNAKFRLFKLGELETLKISGMTINI